MPDEWTEGTDKGPIIFESYNNKQKHQLQQHAHFINAKHIRTFFSVHLNSLVGAVFATLLGLFSGNAWDNGHDMMLAGHGS